MCEKQRVVVTGIGVVTSLGLDETTFWQNLMESRSGIVPIRNLDVSDCKTLCGGEINNEGLNAALAAARIRPLDRAVDMGILAADQALKSAGFVTEVPPAGPLDIGTIFGTGVGSSHSLYEAYTGYATKGIRGLRPTTVPKCMANAMSSQISVRYRLTGPNYVIISACSSSTTAVGVGFRMIRDGYASAVLCGGSDCIFEPASYRSWNNLGVMSKHPDPAMACRPFDANRDGCILGEGAGALVLESAGSARARGVRVRAEVLGFGESSDAMHLTRPEPEGQAKAIRQAIDSAGISPEQIGFINAHGTATKANDEAESESIRMALGPAAGSIPVASNKSFFGHLLGACGIVESIVTILGLENGRVPGNLTLRTPDPACGLRLVGNTPMAIEAPIAIKNSFGFGGGNAVLVFRR
jgi:3-oxoacyl-[acyl-carrier-protein] synthase II